MSASGIMWIAAGVACGLAVCAGLIFGWWKAVCHWEEYGEGEGFAAMTAATILTLAFAAMTLCELGL